MSTGQLVLVFVPWVAVAAVALAGWALVHRGPRPRHQLTRHARGLTWRRKP